MPRLSRLAALAVAGCIGSSFAATITVNSNADTVADDGACTLREAILAANTNTVSGAAPGECVAGEAGLDTIQFALGGGTPSIGVTGFGLPTITEPVLIDGATGGATRVELNGTAGTGSALRVSADGSTIRYLVLNRFPTAPLEVTGGGNHIEGCYIGVDAAGTTAQGNKWAGIYVSGPGNVIGGTTIAARNVISGNGGAMGIYASSFASGTVIQGNYIGTDSTGTSAIPNSSGISSQGPGTLIGGTEPGARNLVSGNTSGGISVGNSTATGNIIQGNYIGTDVTGTVALPNQVGIYVSSSASNALIGGTAPGAGNLISGNAYYGLDIVFSVTGTLVQGNLIGTDASGNVALPNKQGVIVGATSTNNTIGGTTTASRNVISGNTTVGLTIYSASDNNVVQGNFIGVGADGTTALGNGSWGVYLDSSTTIEIGGSVSGSGNRIWNNGNNGILMSSSGAGVSILGNSIRANAGLGIDLYPAGVNPNDAGDSDTGANGLQNFPVLTSANSSDGSTTVAGTLNSVADTSFRIELFANNSCDASGNGEGDTYLGFVTESTTGSGDLSFSTTLPVGLTWGQIVTATATNLATSETSEFSACLTAIAPAIAPVATTSAATVITATGATLNGTVVANDASAAVTFEWGSSNAYGSTATAAESPLPGSATGVPVSAAVTGLACNTGYHYRVTATNSVDSAQGGDQAFTTAACAPAVTTGAASAVTANGATLGGTVTAGGAASTVAFQYGLTTSYGSTATATESPVPGNATNAPVSAAVAALACNTVYHYRVTATSSGGATQGGDQTFTTAACAPAVTTGAASAVTATGATLAGTVTAGGAASTVTFQYGLATSYGSTATATESPVPGNATNATVSASLTGLTCNTVYHYRVTAANSTDSTQGSDQTFTTAACGPVAPVATTGAASVVTTTGATLGGTVTAGGRATTVSFQYGLTTSYGSTATAAESPLPGSATNTPVSASVTGLTCNTVYHYRVTATNSADGVRGSDQTFTTAACTPAVSGANPVGSGTITATLSGCGASCAFAQGTFIPVSGHPHSPPVPPPADYSFPYGLFDFVASGLTAGSTVTITLVYPDNLPASTVYMKYGPTPDVASAHWYPMPATISGNTVILTITDGGLGDDDLLANGSIVDAGGPAISSRSDAAVIPTLAQWSLFLLIGMMGALGMFVAQRRRFG